jgi:cell wall-associated NlpC family hydrolase
MQSIDSILSNISSLNQAFQSLSTANPSSTTSGPNPPANFATLLQQIQAQMPTLMPDYSAPASSSQSVSGSPSVSSLTGLGTVPTSMALGSISPSITSGTTGLGTASNAVGSFGNSVVSDAMQYLGVPYVYGGTSATTGFDCSGFTQHVFADLGVQLPRTAAEQSAVGQTIPSIAQAQPGDLVFYGSPAEHVGIYIGNGMMVNAPTTGQSVSVAPVGTPTDIQRVIAPSQSVAPSELAVAQATGAPSALEPIFQSATAAYGLPPGLLESVAKVESNFNPSAVSSAGAQGLMQIMPQTAQGLGINPMDPTQAIYGAAKLLSEKLNAFGSVPLAAAAYNAGDVAVQTYGGIPPYPETQNYVQSVMSYLGGA